jgi:UDP-glucose 4-epimerase
MRVKDARQTFLGIWIKRIIEGQPLLVFGDGKQIRDFNYVDDVVDALLNCALSEDANGEIFNLGADDPINLKDTAQLMVDVARSGSFELVPFPEDRKVIDIGDYYADYRKIRSKLGWKPAVPLAEGLFKTLNYYRQHAEHYWEIAHAP